MLVRHNKEDAGNGFYYVNWRSINPDLLSAKAKSNAIEIKDSDVPEKPEETADYRYKQAVHPEKKEIKYVKIERTEEQKIEWKVQHGEMKIADVEDEELRERLKEMYPDKE